MANKAPTYQKGTAPVRSTATFVPYYWEAYNQIVQPDRYDWYLVTKWLPTLGPNGFAIIKALRALCYYNPRDGSLRDTCQITVDELADATGMKRTSLYRELESNKALQDFVQRLPEVIHIEGRTRRLPPRWRVCMDSPVHPDDMERYDLLRANKEVDRQEVEEEKRKSQIEIYEKRKSQIEIYEKRKSQIGISGGRKSQNDERESQNSECKSQDGITIRSSLPPVSLPSDVYGADAGSDPHINSPRGIPEEEIADVQNAMQQSSLAGTWNNVLRLVGKAVNKPTFETHIRSLQLVALDKDAGTAQIAAPSAFSRQYIEGRHRQHLEEAFIAELGKTIAVDIVLAGKGEGS